MKRYYICNVIGDGSEFNPRRPMIADITSNWVAQYSDNLSWALVLVEAKNHSLLTTNDAIQPLPDVGLDIKVTSVQKNAVDRMKQDLLAKWSIDAAFMDNQDGYRDVIRYIGRLHNPSFDENDFDVSE